MNCIDFTSKRTKMLSYVAKHSKQRKTWKVTKIPWIASIWWQNDQNNAKLQKWSKYHELHRFDVKTIKTTQNYKSDRITINCMDLTSELSKQRKTWSDQNTMNCIDFMTKRSKQRKTPKVIKIQWLAWIWWQNDQNNAKLRKWSNYNELHRYDVKKIENVELRRKTFKTTLNYKLQWLASIWWQNDHNNAKLRKLSNYDELHRFDDKTIKKLSYVAKHSQQHKATKLIKLQLIASIGCQNDQ